MWIKTAIGIAALAAITAGAVPFLQQRDGNVVDKSLMTYKVSRGDLSVTVTENGMLE
ncbi:MAG: hypothetical protein GY748_01915, partial [Planctomycetaceae bacterium]|nr:hypothetical protein [Planctomycetaceae bacterium]